MRNWGMITALWMTISGALHGLEIESANPAEASSGLRDNVVNVQSGHFLNQSNLTDYAQQHLSQIAVGNQTGIVPTVARSNTPIVSATQYPLSWPDPGNVIYQTTAEPIAGQWPRNANAGLAANATPIVTELPAYVDVHPHYAVQTPGPNATATQSEVHVHPLVPTPAPASYRSSSRRSVTAAPFSPSLLLPQQSRGRQAANNGRRSRRGIRRVRVNRSR